jgi:hypothetical protein
VILHDHGEILGSKSLCDVLTLLVAENDPAVVGVDRQVVMKKTGILLHDIDTFSKCRPGLAVEGVAVSCCGSVGTKFVQSMVNDIPSFVDRQLSAMFGNISIRPNQYEIRCLSISVKITLNRYPILTLIREKCMPKGFIQ